MTQTRPNATLNTFSIYSLAPFFCKMAHITRDKTVCSYERSFSSLRRLTISYIRNTIDQERLICFALINIEKDFKIDIDATVADFVSKKR
jgi:hypothetical protein